MKSNKFITSALVALGIVSLAGVAQASSTVTIGGTTYNVVYVTGSTAFRANVFTAVDAASGGVFDAAPTLQPSTGVTGSTSAYNAYGTIGGTPTLLSFDFTGSEAGIAALENQVAGIPNPYNNALGSSTTAVLAGTPEPTGFLNPLNPSATLTAVADLSFADTSQAVSLSSAKAALTDYGVVAVVTFEWVKGNMSTKDSSWNDLINITDPQANLQLGGSQTASFFTGNPNDQDDVYTIGRNKGSGTRVNVLLDTQHGVNTPVDQFAAHNATYNSGVLTVGANVSLSTAGGLVDVGNDGFDSGSGVSGTLKQDTFGALDTFGSQIITLGYVGISDGNTAISGGGEALTLNGVPENDATVISGAYSFWGHEHLYGTPGQPSTGPAGTVAGKLAGTSKNETLGSGSTAGGALEASFGTGGGRESAATLSTTQSTAIDPAVMLADKPSDAGYPFQL